MSQVYPHTSEQDPTSILFGYENDEFTVSVTGDALRELDSEQRSFFQEAVDRFGSLLLENLKKREMYHRVSGDSMSGVKNTIKHLTAANQEEDTLGNTK